MKTQNIEKIIEKVEACKVALLELFKTASDVADDTTADESEAELGRVESWMVASSTATIWLGAQAQFDELVDILNEINNKKTNNK